MNSLIKNTFTYFVPTKCHELTQAQGDISAQKGQVPVLTDQAFWLRGDAHNSGQLRTGHISPESVLSSTARLIQRGYLERKLNHFYYHENFMQLQCPKTCAKVCLSFSVANEHISKQVTMMNISKHGQK